MTLNLIMNSSNVVTGSNNSRYRYTFIKPLTVLDEASMSVANITMPYSWFNVTAINKNNSFTFHFPDSSSTGTAYNFVLQEGFYSVIDINAALQQFCIANGLYLINGSGKYVYYLTMLYNPTFYAVQIIAQFVPTSLPSGWSEPANWPGYNMSSATPYINIIEQGFGNIIGFNTGYVPTNPFAESSTLSSFTPQGSIVNSLVLRCSLVDNECGFPTDALDTIPITSAFGTNINYTPPTEHDVKCSAGTYQSIEFYFCDQNLNQVYILDNNVCLSILLKNVGKQMTASGIVPLQLTDE
jgi:hypothetical protein